MRLATIATAEGPKAAVGRGDELVLLQDTDSQLPNDICSLLALEGGLEKARKAAEKPDAAVVSTQSVRFLPPILNPEKIVCLGLNYKDHAAESGVPLPREPVLFSKYPSSLIGHGEKIVLPPVSQEVDYEAELVVVVGKKVKNLKPEEAQDCVAGYCIGHDVSARDWQLKKDGKQWMVGKTFDTFAPVGPFLVTADEVPDPHDLKISLRLNGETMQDSSTNQIVFGVTETLVYLSQVFTLMPGDLIFTGTPPGVGFARKPPVYLKDGDIVEIEIEKLGLLSNPVVQG